MLRAYRDYPLEGKMYVHTRWAAAIMLIAVAATTSADQLLWDNYPGGVPALQNINYCMSSERNTGVWDSTWVVDDVDLTQIPGIEPADVTLTRLEWVGARDAGYGYSTCDVIILDDDFNTLLELDDLPYSSVDHPQHTSDGLQLYEGNAELAEHQHPAFDLPLDLPEHFYIGVRLVGDGYYAGANRAVTSSIDSTLRGRTEGYTLAPLFGAPDWKPASDVWYAPPTGSNFEFAMRVYADVIPEPASLIFLLTGVVFMLRRRSA
jgi:hypothetical protein